MELLIGLVIAYAVYNEVDKLKTSGVTGKSILASIVSDVTSLFHHSGTPPTAAK